MELDSRAYQLVCILISSSIVLISSSRRWSTGHDVADPHQRSVVILGIVMQADLLVQYEKLPAMFQTVRLWRQIALSVVLNWILGPFVSLIALLVM